MSSANMFKPKLLEIPGNYSRSQFGKDLMAGVIVGIVALPLAIAFAIASGVSPEKGLFTAIIAGFIISAMGGSRVQIGGPTGAFIVIVYGIVQQYGVNGLIIATFIAGVILIILGFARLGSVIKFIPHPLIVGFTGGIALIIFSSQVKDFLGLKMGAVPADFIGFLPPAFAMESATESKLRKRTMASPVTRFLVTNRTSSNCWPRTKRGLWVQTSTCVPFSDRSSKTDAR